MTETRLMISGPTETKEMSLNPKGITLGRGAGCDVILDNPNVSRVHARISQDPFGRWIIEDIESHNGVFIEGQRIKAQAVLPNQKISIEPFTISLVQESNQPTDSVSSIHSTLPIVDKGSAEDRIIVN